jgi:hypothetical protein
VVGIDPALSRGRYKDPLGFGAGSGDRAIQYAQKFSIRLFVNKPDANRETSMKDPHYVGTINALDGESRRGEVGPDVSHSFPVILGLRDANFYKLVKTGESFTVTMARRLVPVKTTKVFRFR